MLTLMAWSRPGRLLALGVAATLSLTSAAAYSPVTATSAPDSQAAAWPSPVEPLTVHAADDGEDASERSAEEAVAGRAVALAADLGAVTTGPEGEICAPELLRVSWAEPDDGYAEGAHIAPVGPAPDESTTSVNGIVVCSGYSHAYMGFEALIVAGEWHVFDIPDPDAESEGAEQNRGGDADPPPTSSSFDRDPISGPIEGYARYEPQRVCNPTAKPGTVALRDMLLTQYPGTRNYGIVRACMIGGRSEHKEGRALDWGVHVSRPAERAAADDFLAWLLATDDAGNHHAMARRMGVMYVIWNRQIWSAHTPGSWRAYRGASPHIDHVHISLSWDGAMGRTSFWSGDFSLAVSSGQGSDSGSASASPAGTRETASWDDSGDRSSDSGRPRGNSRQSDDPSNVPARSEKDEAESKRGGEDPDKDRDGDGEPRGNRSGGGEPKGVAEDRGGPKDPKTSNADSGRDKAEERSTGQAETKGTSRAASEAEGSKAKDRSQGKVNGDRGGKAQGGGKGNGKGKGK